MHSPAVIALLTDFGLNDAYVGVMRGVIATIAPNISVIDITHQIPPQNIAAARYCLMEAYPYFPVRTTYIAVVDPGVGSKRRAIAIQLAQGYLVGPDNGIFQGIIDKHEPKITVELDKSRYWRTNRPSATFHGRDIFAAVGAHLASGVPIQDVGTEIDRHSLVTLPLNPYYSSPTRIEGTIQYIDSFGNLITNIPSESLGQASWRVEVKGSKIFPENSYSDVSVGKAVAIIGSHGWLEIAVNCGNAAEELKLSWGDRLQVILEDR